MPRICASAVNAEAVVGEIYDGSGVGNEIRRLSRGEAIAGCKAAANNTLIAKIAKIRSYFEECFNVNYIETYTSTLHLKFSGRHNFLVYAYSFDKLV